MPATFAQGDAADPPLAPRGFDVVLSRHVLWALPDPSAALARGSRCGGRAAGGGGSRASGAPAPGLTARRCADLVPEYRASAVVQRLTDPQLWGGAVDDERYLLLSTG